MGTKYHYNGDVIGVESWSFIRRKRGVVDNMWIVRASSTNKQVAPKTLVSATKEATQELLDAWAAKKGLEAVVEEPELEANGGTPGNWIPVGALKEHKTYFLCTPPDCRVKVKYVGCMDGKYQFILRDSKGMRVESFTVSRLNHYEIRDVVGI